MTPEQTTESAVDQVAELLEARIGLRPEQTVRARLRRCVQDEAARQDLDPARYLEVLTADSHVFEALLNRVTVQETGFFRHPEQFASLTDAILPTVRPPVRIWSAGCANGQEAFSLAMILEERGLDGFVVATDLSVAALARTAVGRYTGREMAGLSPDRIARHFTRVGGDWEAKKSLQDRVIVRRHNLIDPFPVEVRGSQVVFCRNVLIYIAHEQARIFLQRIADTIAPVALFLGSAEAIWPVTDRFEAVRVGDTFVHRPRRLIHADEGDSSAGPRRAALGPEPETTARRPTGRPRSHRVAAGRRRSAPAAADAPPESLDDSVATARLSRTGQRALSAGDAPAAVVNFRKWAYLTPGDPLAQLHLGLALEAAGDRAAASRAYAASRRLALESDPSDVERGTGGFARDELLRLLDDKHRGSAQ